MESYHLGMFPEGAVVRNVKSGKTYIITQQYIGHCNLLQQGTTRNECWRHNGELFTLVSVKPIDLSIVCLIGK